ncbi:ChaN family lipoprotein [Edwardsiella piscicida]|uniref:ChaN family lipoprotein n=3 Tax=Edwardsiella TaxID=635 RepID=A0AAQ3H5Q2_EDWPI|nr:ChaN family lipoprotein [Edwardsiella piscicida]ACY83968.1 hypothetical protein ETAE_1123 [Edwardsiella tarda EIB202]ADM41168.1 putative lipoprotein [Edwardsiella tarda FL6-60]BAU80404.1 hypothetical protein SAMD00131843_00055 [Edwardsiella tarda]AOP42541.1 ChaN family lipoprotein [Edwardsiella piscicida]ARD17273.1 hypothetical protein BXA22_02460 [Edwardsiella piscicida]
MRTMLLTLALLALSGCQTPAPVAERIVSLVDGQTLTPTQLAQRLAASPRVIVGERHDNPRHQQIAHWLLLQMSALRPQGSVLLEMLTPDQQAGVAAARQPSLSDAQVVARLQWSSGWPWAQYGPLVRSALQGGYPLLAANLGSEALAEIRRRPRLPPGALSTQDAVQIEISAALRGAHETLDSTQLTQRLAVQQWRDRRMAQALLAAPLPALFITGAFHARRDLGVPLHIEDEEPLTEVSVLILAPPGARVGEAQADYVWYTASARL